MFKGFLPPVFITYQEKCMPHLDRLLGGGGGNYVWTRLGIIGRVGEVGRLEGLSCSVGDAWSRLSHTCSSWYFPRFLLRVGSFTCINIASLMVLE